MLDRSLRQINLWKFSPFALSLDVNGTENIGMVGNRQQALRLRGGEHKQQRLKIPIFSRKAT